MVTQIGLIRLLTAQKILLVGDLMLDRYTLGKASRISPEAPVAVLHVREEKSLPGGAGNVALNLLSLGQEVLVLGRHGPDGAGEELAQVLSRENADTKGVFLDETYRTPVKNRILADNQQMIRIDHEFVTPLSIPLEKEILANLPTLLEGVKVMAISDYGKGLLSKGLLRGLIDEAKRQKIPVIADPKGVDFTKYRGTTVLKPNLKEAYAAAGLPLDTPLEDVAEKLLSLTEVDSLLITRSEAGISIFEPGSRRDFSVKVKEVKDVTGAGDTVLAVVTACMASGLTLDQAAELANVAASMAIEHVGCARITATEMADRLLSDHAQHKLIEKEHSSSLYFALENRPHTILELSNEARFDPALFQEIQSLKKDPLHTLVLSVPESVKCPHLISMLISLREVDFVLKKGNL